MPYPLVVSMEKHEGGLLECFIFDPLRLGAFLSCSLSSGKYSVEKVTIRAKPEIERETIDNEKMSHHMGDSLNPTEQLNMNPHVA